MKKTLIISLIILTVIFSGCAQQIHSAVQKPITGLDNGTVKVIREDEGPSQGGTLNLFMLSPDTLNPLKTQNPYVRHMSSFIFDVLFYENEDGSLRNSLVDSYAFSQDGLILDINLKDNVLFHDGMQLTSDDVAFTIEEIKNAGGRSLYGNHVINIQSVKPVTRLSVRIILQNFDPRITEKLTFPIVPSHIFNQWPVEGHGEGLKVIGTGPFRFESFYDNLISLKRNDSWWNNQTADGLNHPIWLDGINFKVYSNESDMMQAFQKMEIDIAFIEEGNLESYAKRSDILFNKYEGNALEFLILSAVGRTGSVMGKESFRDSIIKYLIWYSGNNPINKGKSAVPSGDDSSAMNRDKTLEALTGAGFTYQEDKNILIFNKDGAKIPVNLTLFYNGLNDERKDVAQWVASALFEIGIQVDLSTATYLEQQAYIKTGKFDMMVLGCRMPLYADISDTFELLRKSLNLDGQNAVNLPLYSKYGAVLYHNRIRGSRNPVWKNIYNGWTEWYLVKSQE